MIWVQICPSAGEPGWRSDFVFVAVGASAPAAPVDPQVLAEQAIASMVMQAPVIRMAPPAGSGGGLVGVPVWMWVEGGEQETGPMEASASAGGVTVTAVGQVSQVVWNMGDGTSVTCGLGTPYVEGIATASPDCGHVYTRASTRHVPDGGAWPITATSTWTITWSGGGQSGTEELELSSTAELLVAELQVLNQQGGGS